MSSAFDSYRLYYADKCEQIESIRLIFAYANQQFEEILCEKDDWCYIINSEIPFEQMPILEFNGIKYPPSFAVYHFLARKFRLTGKSDVEQFKCEIIGEIIQQINEQYHQLCLLNATDQTKRLFVENYLPLKFKHLEQLFENYSKDGIHFVGNNITWIDLIVYNLIDKFLDICDDKQFLDKYSRLKKNREEICKNPKIADYLKHC